MHCKTSHSYLTPFITMHSCFLGMVKNPVSCSPCRSAVLIVCENGCYCEIFCSQGALSSFSAVVVGLLSAVFGYFGEDDDNDDGGRWCGAWVVVVELLQVT
jgi:hypothetical protein